MHSIRSPFVTRVHKLGGVSLPTDGWPSCTPFYRETFETDSWYDWVWFVPYTPHGPVHSMIGGYTNTGDVFERFREILPEAAIGAFAIALVTLPKNIYRMVNSSLEYPSYCSWDTPQDQCHMICPKEWLDSSSPESYDLATVLRQDWALQLRMDPERWAKFISAICKTPFSPGDQLESGSPVDPSFWPIHPEIERLLIYKLIQQPFTHSEWANPNGTTTYCIYDSIGGCQGHHPYDITHFAMKVKDATTGHFSSRFLTNAEIFHYMDPDTYALQYIYDTFEWNHCVGSQLFPQLQWATGIS